MYESDDDRMVMRAIDLTQGQAALVEALAAGTGVTPDVVIRDMIDFCLCTEAGETFRDNFVRRHTPH